MNSPFVSVVTPCYNYGAYLGETLDSLIAQTYPHWECWVIDDGSTDNSAEVAQAYAARDARIRFVHQKNSGPAAARNAGLQRCTGDYIQLLDADDLLEPDKFHLQVELMEACPKIGLVYSSMLQFWMAEEPRKYHPVHLSTRPVSGSGLPVVERLLEDLFFLPGAALARRSLYEATGPYDNRYTCLEDWDHFYKMALGGHHFEHDPREGVRLIVRNHGSNISGATRNRLYHRALIRGHLLSAFTAQSKSDVLSLDAGERGRLLRMQKALFYRDRAVYERHFGSPPKGIAYLLANIYYTGIGQSLKNGIAWLRRRNKAL